MSTPRFRDPKPGELRKAELLDEAMPPLAQLIHEAIVVLGGIWTVARCATDDARQAAEYAKGRTIKGTPPYPRERPLGDTVTEAKNSHETAHGIRVRMSSDGQKVTGACAVDLLALSENGRAVENDPCLYIALGEFVKAHGFIWGGDFKRFNKTRGRWQTFFDGGHVEVADWKTLPLST